MTKSRRWFGAASQQLIAAGEPLVGLLGRILLGVDEVVPIVPEACRDGLSVHSDSARPCCAPACRSTSLVSFPSFIHLSLSLSRTRALSLSRACGCPEPRRSLLTSALRHNLEHRRGGGGRAAGGGGRV